MMRNLGLQGTGLHVRLSHSLGGVPQSESGRYCPRVQGNAGMCVCVCVCVPARACACLYIYGAFNLRSSNTEHVCQVSSVMSDSLRPCGL